MSVRLFPLHTLSAPNGWSAINNGGANANRRHMHTNRILHVHTHTHNPRKYTCTIQGLQFTTLHSIMLHAVDCLTPNNRRRKRRRVGWRSESLKSKFTKIHQWCCHAVCYLPGFWYNRGEFHLWCSPHLQITLKHETHLSRKSPCYSE